GPSLRPRQPPRRRRGRARPGGARVRVPRAGAALRAPRLLARLPHGARPGDRRGPGAGHVRQGAQQRRTLPARVQVLELALQDRQQRRDRSPPPPAARHDQHRRVAARHHRVGGRGHVLRRRGARPERARAARVAGARHRDRAGRGAAAPDVPVLHLAAPRGGALVRGDRADARPPARHRQDVHPPRPTRAPQGARRPPRL
ncbi:MAG: RNA polymerase ECF-type sigma factor, partial [uncultured Gemmatimonadaceae bacterium]